MKTLPRQLPDILPLATQWAADQEKMILRFGVALDTDGRRDAAEAGVMLPDRIRILAVPSLPRPEPEAIVDAATASGLLTESSLALTFGYGIFLRSGHERNRELRIHEFVHVAQFERLAGIEPFLRLFLLEAVDPGFPNGMLEREARIRAQQLVSA